MDPSEWTAPRHAFARRRDERSARAALVGAAAGVSLVLFAAPWLDPLLFDESTHDPLVIAAVAALVVVVMVIANVGPARRAMRVDPLIALRTD